MKLTRRNILLSLKTATIIGLADQFQAGQAQSPLLITQSNSSLPWLEKENLNKEMLYKKYLELAQGGVKDSPVLFYQGINTSSYQNQIKDYPHRLTIKPDKNNIISAIESDDNFSSYPSLGEVPKIDETGLNFLHSDIKEACICLGSFSTGELTTKWLGRDAILTGEFWSATKIFPLLYVLSQANRKFPNLDLNNCQIRGINQEGKDIGFTFYDLAKDIVSYDEKIATSNSLGAMFKRFTSQLELEKWLINITGNQDLVFRGYYGEDPYIDQPKFLDSIINKVVLSPDSNPPRCSSNNVSAYDLVRIITQIGWHNYLPETAQIKQLKWQNLGILIKAMGHDSARLTDLAIENLGLKDDVDSVVILSKLGNGATSIRHRTEAVYVALIQLIDNRPTKTGKFPRMLTLSMALRGAFDLPKKRKLASSKKELDTVLDEEVRQLDARMATEVTNIIWTALHNDLNIFPGSS